MSLATGTLLLCKRLGWCSKIITSFTSGRFNHWAILIRSEQNKEEILKEGLKISLYGKYLYTLDTGPPVKSMNNLIDCKSLFLTSFDDVVNYYDVVCARAVKALKISEEEFSDKILSFIEDNKDINFQGFYHFVKNWAGLKVDYEAEGYSCAYLTAKFIRDVYLVPGLDINVIPSDFDVLEVTESSKFIDLIFDKNIIVLSRKYDLWSESFGFSILLILIWFLIIWFFLPS